MQISILGATQEISWRKIPKQHKKGFNSLVILGAWILWKHRNAGVFDESAPNIQSAPQAF